MALNFSIILLGLWICILCEAQTNQVRHGHEKQQGEFLAGIEFASQFQTMDSCLHAQHAIESPDCGLEPGKPSEHYNVQFQMKHRSSHPLHEKQSKTESLEHSMLRDMYRIRGINIKAMASSSQACLSKRGSTESMTSVPTPQFASEKESSPQFRPSEASPSPSPAPLPWPQGISSHVESGVTLGSGEYFMDVYIGSPPRHFMLIMDTGSDLIWTQCNPCKNCYEQEGPLFTPNSSSSYRLVTCSEPQCKLVYNANPDEECTEQKPHSCKYSYWYGDKSNTTGELALETMTFNLPNGHHYTLNGLVIGCGYSNYGLFRGAAGLLGLGKGPLSFPSQLHNRFGRKFSYCLVSRNSDLNVSSMLTFGEDERLTKHPHMQYTGFVNHTSAATFYYLSIAKVSVGGVDMLIPAPAWTIGANGQGGTIIDSGTTLTYFVKEAYEQIVMAFESQIMYPKIQTSLLDHCFNVSGQTEVQLPTFSISFADGAVLSPPLENYFIEVETEPPILCLALLEAPAGSPSILGNYLQQNIHLLYDVGSHRLGFAHVACNAL